MTTDTDQQTMAGLTGAATAMISGAASNLEDFLGVPVDFKLLTVAGDVTADPEPAGETLHLNAAFDGVISGDSWLVLAVDDAKSIVRIMTQAADVSEDELLGELGVSAFSEAMIQLISGAATALSDGLGERIDISLRGISKDPEQGPERADMVAITYQGEMATDASPKVVWQVNRNLAQGLDDRWPAAIAPPPAAATPGRDTAPAEVPAPTAAAPGGGGVIDSVEFDVAVELGDVAMTIGELLHMGEGSVVSLTQSVGDNVVMLANGTPVASGEVVIVDGTLGFRVLELVTEAKGA